MKKILILLAIPVLLVGCDSWLDVNKDPNSPTDVPISLLLPTIELNATYSLCSGKDAGLGQDLGVYTHQLSTREEANEYGVTGSEYYLDLSWTAFYTTTLENVNKLMEKADQMNAPYYAGIAKIMKAYLFSQYVDVFGDIPFSEANKKDKGVLYAKFDKGADIYPELLKILDSGVADLRKPKGSIFPGSDDVIFAGNATKWIRTANTIKLKLLTQTRLTSNVTSQVEALLAKPDSLMKATADGFMFPFNSVRSPENRNPAFVDLYEATQKSTHISPWFFEIMKGINPVFLNIPDPRIPYYFYNQMSPSEVKGRDGNQFEYRVGGFVSIYFGSKGPDRDRSQDKSLTVYGIYPCGGRFDSGDAKQVGAESGTGAAPYRFLTYADKLFLEAELIQSGVINGDAKTKLSDAITEAFKQVDYVVSVSKGSQTVPVLATSTEFQDYLTKILSLFESSDASKKMEIIMTQKWISSFGSYVDQYTDYRRTGYPVMFDPKNTTMAPGGFVTPPAGGDPDRTLPPVKVSCALNYPLSLPWAISELNLNVNAPQQKNDPSQYKVFWDK